MAWERYRKTLLLIILAFAFFTRIWRLEYPSGYIFDEVYHASTAKLIAKNDPRAFEWNALAAEKDTAIDWLHPPLAKYTQAFFIKVLGETSFAWRLSSALFGVGLIYLVYLLSEELFGNHKLSLLAAFLASLDGLLLVMSRIAMNDIHVSFFILLTLIFYLRYKKQKDQSSKNKKLFLVGLGAGLAMASKWSGIFVLIPIYLSEIYNLFKNKLNLKQVFNLLILLVVLPFSIYVLSYIQMFLQGKSWSHFAELNRQILHYQTHLTATHSYQSRPLQWFLNTRPVWVWVSYGDSARADIYAQGNSVLFWMGDIAVLLTLTLVILNLFQNLFRFKIKIPKQVRSDMEKLLFLLLSYFVVWLLWIFSPRIMFFYHYTPAIPLLCIILAYWLIKLDKRYHYLVLLILYLIALNFLLFYPHWTGMLMPNAWKENLYFVFEFWR